MPWLFYRAVSLRHKYCTPCTNIQHLYDDANRTFVEFYQKFSADLNNLQSLLSVKVQRLSFVGYLVIIFGEISRRACKVFQISYVGCHLKVVRTPTAPNIFFNSKPCEATSCQTGLRPEIFHLFTRPIMGSLSCSTLIFSDSRLYLYQ